MNSKRLFYLLAVAVVLLCGGLVGGAYFADQAIQQYSKDIVDKRTKVDTLDAQQSSLATAKQQIIKYEDLASIAQSIVPQDKDQAQTVREIVNIAEEHGVTLGSISFPSSSLGQTVTPGATVTVPAGKAALSQLTPVKDIPGVYSLQIIVASNEDAPVPYDKFIKFLNDLEHNRRTALVSSIDIQPSDKVRGAVSFTLTLDEYIKP